MDYLTLLSYPSFAIVSFAALFYIWAKYKQTYWQRRGVHSPPAHWLFGHIRDAVLMRASPSIVLGELHKSSRDEPLVGIYILQKPFLLLRDHRVIKQILVKDFSLFPNRHFASQRRNDTVATDNLFSIENPHWQFLRSKLLHAFTSGKQKRLFELMVESADFMRDYLSARVPASATLEARSVSTKFITDVISSLTFGVRTNSFDEPEPEFFRRTAELSAQTFGRTLQLFVNFFFPSTANVIGGNIFGEHEPFFRRVFQESLAAREKEGIGRGDLIDMLVQLKNSENKEFEFNDDQLLAQSAIFFGAGLETSAVTMSFALFQLAKHPDVQEKVRAELCEKLGAEKLTYERMAEITYLQRVIAETLRMYPPAPLIDRVALQDYKIPDTDVTIEKGTVVYAVLTGLHFDPDYHPEPYNFDPNRFSEERKSEIKPCTYMPFGDGPRVCIGQRTGQLQTMVGLITILREYEVSLDTSYANEVSRRAIFLAPAKGMHLIFKKSPIAN